MKSATDTTMGIYLSFEMQCRRHQKSKAEVLAATKRTNVLQNIFQNEFENKGNIDLFGYGLSKI